MSLTEQVSVENNNNLNNNHTKKVLYVIQKVLHRISINGRETCIPHMIGKNKWQRKFLFPHKDEHQLTVVCFKNLLMCDSKFNKQKCKWDDKKNVLVLTSTSPSSFNWFEKKLLIQSKWGSQTKHYFKVLLHFCKHIFITKNVPIICMQLYTERDIDLKWNYFNA